jgi:hypothetical protein
LVNIVTNPELLKKIGDFVLSEYKTEATERKKRGRENATLPPITILK